MDLDGLDDVLAPDWVGDPSALSMRELRERRGQAQAVEVTLSYQRRVAQGRLDIVAAERRRRNEGGDPLDHEQIVAQLSAILAPHTRSPGAGRLSQLLAPDPAGTDTAELDAIAGPTVLASLHDVPDAELDELLGALADFEVRCSALRRELHDRIDLLQGEVVRRYRTGEATVENLLQ